MRIGYVVSRDNVEKLEPYCDEVIVRDPEETLADSFRGFIENNMKNEVMVHSIEDIGLQLIQLLPSFEKIVQENKILYFLETLNLDEEVFFDTVYQLASLDGKIMRARTMKGLKEAKVEGRVGGRPKINDETIERMAFLHQKKHKSIREIAAICNVSVGTAYKYVTQAARDKERRVSKSYDY